MRYLELKVPPLVLVVVIGGAMWLVARLFPQLSFDLPARFYFALLALVTGLTIAIAGVYEFRKAKTTVDPTRPTTSSTVVRSGVYHYSRNPMYVGFLMVLVAWALYLSNIAPVVFIAVFVVYLNKFQIAPEEHWLREKFGADYESYMLRVRRWL